MPPVEPEIDDRNYEDILNEALARIPVHNPEWTNFNDSDPGITLVQLFAYMTDKLFNRSNLIPKRSRLKFLKLLSINLQPVEAARGIVAFSNLRGPLEKSIQLSSGLELYAGQVPFRTQNGLYVLPVEGRVFYKSVLSEERLKKVEALYDKLYASFLEENIKLVKYETKELEPPASGVIFPVVDLAGPQDAENSSHPLDNSLWVALLVRSNDVVEKTRKAIANKILTLGIMPELKDAYSILFPEGTPSEVLNSDLVYEIPLKNPDTGWTLPEDEPEKRMAMAVFRKLEAYTTVDLLSKPGVVQLKLPDSDDLGLWENLDPLEQGAGNFPPSLEDTNIQDRVITWIRIRLQSPKSSKQQLKARISWVGINVSTVVQKAHVTSETLEKGTGEPDQLVTLVNTPVIPESVTLTVNGEQWYEIDDLLNAYPEVPVRSSKLPSGSNPPAVKKDKVNVYTIDRRTGKIQFGNGLRGARPPFGSIIRVSYDYGGGPAGMVGIGSIKKSPSLPAGVNVSNPLPTWGGSEEESIEEAEKRIPLYLKHRNRLVTRTDFEEIIMRTPGVNIGRVEMLPLVHPALPDVDSPGVVTVLVIPAYDHIQPDAPLPDRLFLDTVCEYFNPMRLITTEVHVRGPEYVPVWVSIGVEVIPGLDIAPVLEEIKKSIKDFLSPLTGGFNGKGWQVNKNVEASELLTVAARVTGVSEVKQVLLAGMLTEDIVKIDGLKLPRLMGLAVQEGEPQEMAELTGEQKPGGVEGAIEKVYVPVVSHEYEC
jgi:hypothetical protein